MTSAPEQTTEQSEGTRGEVSGAEIVLDEVVKQYPGQKTPAVDTLSLTIPAGEIVMFVGPSGCGKTTSLKMINRLIEPTSGTIRIDGNDVRQQSETELRRHVGYVIQGGSLFPHMTVAKNIAIVPKLLGWDAKRIDDAGRRAARPRGPRPRRATATATPASSPAASSSASASPAGSRPTRR